MNSTRELSPSVPSDDSNRSTKPTYDELLARVAKLEGAAAALAGTTALRETERQLRAIIEQSPISMAIVSMDGTIEYINRRAVETFGYLHEDIPVMDRWWLQAYPDQAYRSEVVKTWMALIEKAIALGQEIERREYRVTCKDGAVKTMVIFGVIVAGQVFVMFEDITERKRTEEALRENQQHLQAIVGGTSDAVFLKDCEGRYVLFNAAASNSSIGNPTEVIGRDCTALFPADEARRLIEDDREVMASGTIRTSEELVTTGDGEKRVFLSTKGPVFDGNGTVVGLFGIARDITERKQAEAALRNSEERFRAFFDLGLIGLAITSPEKGWLQVNNRLCQMLEYREDELLALTWAQLTHPDDLAADVVQFQRLLDGKIDGYEIEKRFVTRSGRILLANLVVRCVRKPDHSVDYCVAMVEDVTEHKRGEEELGTILRTTIDGFYLVDLDGRILDANDAYCSMIGYSREELRQIGVAGVEAIEAPEVIQRRIQRILETGSDRFVTKHIRKDGRAIDVEAAVNLLREPGRLFIFMRDITEHRQAEEALAKAQAHYKILLDTSTDGIHILNRNGDLVEASPSFYRMLGYSPDAPPPLRVEDWDTQWSAEELKVEIAKLLDHPAIFETRHRRRDGQVLDVEVSSRRIELDDQVYLYNSSRDITDRRQAEEAKARLEDQLRQAQKLESVGRLAGGVAHDFNNMLAVIMGHTEMALDQLEASHPLQRSLLQIEKAAKHSADLTNQLLTFARRQRVTPKVMDLNDTVETTLKMLNRLIGEGIVLTWNPGVHLWPVKIDPTQIEQILANLCVNARDAISGEGRLAIETRNTTFDAAVGDDFPETAPGDYVVLTVSDTGCGMSKETLARIFEPFFTTKELGQGTGLGLATVYGIVTQNGGFVTVDSELGVGTTFRIHLPSHANESTEVRPSARSEAVEGRGETVLLVEDEPAILEMADVMLQLLGYEVLTADTPEEALRLAREHDGEVHLLLTDVVMPKMNGRDLATRVIELRPEVKTLFMSGYARDVIDQQDGPEDNVRFLHKPFAMRELAVGVRQALDGN